jgi:AraC-like DNA-binding protein
VSCVTVKYLFECLNLSERQFEKRFSQTVGLTPQFYIRVKRYNEAVRLMHTRQFENLTDLAHHLNYYDQSHFVRDIKALSGMTPKSLFNCYAKEPLSTAASLYYQNVDAFDERDGFLQF